MTIKTITSHVVAKSNDSFLIEPSCNNIEIVLPKDPKIGDYIKVYTSNNTNTIVKNNGNFIEGLNEDLVLDLPNVNVTLISTSDGWKLTETYQPDLTSEDIKNIKTLMAHPPVYLKEFLNANARNS